VVEHALGQCVRFTVSMLVWGSLLIDRRLVSAITSSTAKRSSTLYACDACSEHKKRVVNEHSTSSSGSSSKQQQ
jgi:hypothetical protein